jgi:2,3-bisphosphoglycerate-independent phosphoglycerate mutase
MEHPHPEPAPRHIVFVFLDGVGLGPESETNPLAVEDLPAFRRLAGGQAWTLAARPLIEPDHVFIPIDARLGVDGLPQSGTGQATLLTGVNCAAVAGRHYGPFPHSLTRPVIASRNVFSRVAEHNPHAHPEPAAFANAYPPRFFSYVAERDRWTVTTRCCLDAGVPIRDHQALRAGLALSADLTAEGWLRFGLDVDPISEEEAGRRLVRIGRQHRFTLYEYYLTDKAGHSRSAPRASQVLVALDRFLGALLDALDTTTDLLVISSDHGNLEDLDTKSHTLNPVPLVATGPRAHRFATVTDLTGVVPALMDSLAGR